MNCPICVTHYRARKSNIIFFNTGVVRIVYARNPAGPSVEFIKQTARLTQVWLDINSPCKPTNYELQGQMLPKANYEHAPCCNTNCAKHLAQ